MFGGPRFNGTKLKVNLKLAINRSTMLQKKKGKCHADPTLHTVTRRAHTDPLPPYPAFVSHNRTCPISKTRAPTGFLPRLPGPAFSFGAFLFVAVLSVLMSRWSRTDVAADALPSLPHLAENQGNTNKKEVAKLLEREKPE